MGKAVDALAEFLGGMLAGIAVGYAGALLLAPREGAATRARVRDTALTLKAAPAQVAGEVQGRVQSAVEEGRRAAAGSRRELESVAGFRADMPADDHPAPDRPLPTSAI